MKKKTNKEMTKLIKFEQDKIDVLLEDNEKLAMDCHIQRALASGEMHEWFVCGNVYKIGLSELGLYWDEVKKDQDYVKKLREINSKIKLCRKERSKWRKALCLKNMEDGRKYTKLQLALFGFDKDIIETHGI